MAASAQLAAGVVGALRGDRAPRGGHQHPVPQDIFSGRASPIAAQPRAGPQSGTQQDTVIYLAEVAWA
eukprot:8894686-Alexandrium_andersonii.AAC.1